MDVCKKLWTTPLLFTFATLSLAACGNAEQGSVVNNEGVQCQSTAVPNQYIVRWKDGSTSVESAADQKELLNRVVGPNIDRIEYVEQDQYVHLNDVGTDVNADVATQGGASQAPDNWGQTMVDAQAAWSAGYDGQGVTIAVVDTGVATTHPQLAPNIYSNSGEIPANNIDDDNNGYVDDVSGWDYVANTGAVSDPNGHGTHVSGIAAANNTTSTPVQGIAPKAKILPLRFLDATGSGVISSAIAPLAYATAAHAKIVNASWGGNGCTLSLQKAVAALEAGGTLFVSAAGNSSADLDTDPEYPAAFGLSGQITVAASTYVSPGVDIMDGNYSNYSYTLVNIMAPGTSIISTWPGGGTANLSGTSMATPFVSGAAAILWSARPNATVAQIKQALLSGVDTGNIAVSSHGRLNIQKAVAALLAALP